MMNVRIDDRHSYVEIEVFGQYQPERMPEVMTAMKRLADRNGYFSELEIHHGKPGNMFQAMARAMDGVDAEDPEAAAFLTKMHRYALVSDSPGLFMRIMIMLGQLGSPKAEMRLFKAHERDLARQWIEEPRAVINS